MPIDGASNGYRDTGGNSSGYQYNTANSGKTSGQNLDMIFTDKSKQSLSMDDFLNLMVMQMSNQDFTNPMDDSQMLAQMAQFSSLQAMQELTSYTKQNFVTSLLGQTVTAAKFTVSGDVTQETGPVEKISLVNNEYTITINGQNFALEQIMELHSGSTEADMGFDTSTMPLKTGALTDTWTEILWDAPASNAEAAKGLKYSLYYSKEPIKSVDQIEEKGTLVGNADQPGMTSSIILGLEPGTTYYVNVIVKNPAGDKSAYKMFTVTTTGEAKPSEKPDSTEKPPETES